MKKFYAFLFAAVALVGFAACNSDSTEEPAPQKENMGKMEFKANADFTKTQLDGLSVKWCETDVITINGETFTVKSLEDDGLTAIFEGNPVEAPYYAVYGGSNSNLNEVENQTCATVTLTANINIDNFRDGANIAVAYSETTSLSFKNVLSVLKFQVAAKCDEITISSIAPLVGEFAVNCNTAEIVEISKERTEFTLSGDFGPGMNYYTTVLPGTHELTITTNVETTKPSKEIVRNKIYNLGVLPVEVPTYSVYVTPQPNSPYSEWSGVNLYAWNDGGWNNEWPGHLITNNTKVINGYTYYTYTFPTEVNGTTVSVIPNCNGTQTSNITLGILNSDYYVVYSSSKNLVYTEAPAEGSIEEYVKPESKLVIYLNPEFSGWKQNNERYAAYFWNPIGPTWVDMTDTDKDGLYECEVPDGATQVIICRMIGSSSTNDWSYKWDQTDDLTVPTDEKTVYTVTSSAGGKAKGSWGVK